MGEFINDNLELEYTKARRILLQEKEINLELKSITAKFEKKKEQIKKEFEKNDKELEDKYSIEEKKLIRELEYINKEKVEIKKSISEEFKKELQFIKTPKLSDLTYKMSFPISHVLDNGFKIGDSVTFKSNDFDKIKKVLCNKNELLIYPISPNGIIVGQKNAEIMIVLFISTEKKEYIFEIPWNEIKLI